MEYVKDSKISYENGTKVANTTETVTFNINSYVRVKLSKHGFNHWMEVRRQKAVPPSKIVAKMTVSDLERYYLHEFAIEVNHFYVGDGWYEFQMWSLISIFGSLFNEVPLYYNHNHDDPFEPNIVLIERSYKHLDRYSAFS